MRTTTDQRDEASPRALSVGREIHTDTRMRLHHEIAEILSTVDSQV